MALAGGTSLALLYGIYRALAAAGGLTPLLRPVLFCFFGCILITALEFLLGCVCNLWLRLAVWDYGGKKHNLYGQVCLSYMGYWALLCLPVYFLLNLFT